MEKSTLEGRPPEEPGALERLSRDDSSRKRFLKMAGGTGAAGAFALLLAACGGDEEKQPSSSQQQSKKKSGTAQFGEGDIGIANYALTLEYLEADFYDQVEQSGLFTDKKTVDLVKAIGENEQEHVDALKAMIEQAGGKPAKEVKFGGDLSDPKKVLQLAATVENTGAAAYLGQAGEIQNEDILAAALSIHSVEARHAATLNDVIEQPITPDGAFAKPMTADEVLKAVTPLIAS